MLKPEFKMKQYPWKFKLGWDGIEWGKSEVTLDSDLYFYYFKWGLIDKEQREAMKSLKWPLVGISKTWYDGPHAQLSLYFFGFHWSTPWTSYDRKKYD